jgi:hypothetical protein
MGETEKRVTPAELVGRILKGPATASQDLRARAFNNADVPEPIRGLIDKVANRAAQITDADFADAASAGVDDEQLFELVICAAVGQANRQYEAAQAALSEATGGRPGG